MNKVSILTLIFIISYIFSYQISHYPNQFSFYIERGFHKVYAPDFLLSGPPGAPQLLVKYLHYIIPPNMKADTILIERMNFSQIPGSYYIFPVQRPVPLCSTPIWTPPDSNIYNSDFLYPNKFVEIVNQSIFDSARLVTIAVYPLQYRPRSRRVFLVNNIEFKFHFTPTTIPERPRIRGINAQKVYDKILSAFVENKNEIPIYYQPPTLIKEEEPRPLTPTTFTIITNDRIEGMMEEFQPFADWLTEKGVPAVVYPLSLALRYPGRDDAEKLRNFIKDIYKNCGTVWILIGGDGTQTSLPVPSYVDDEEIIKKLIFMK